MKTIGTAVSISAKGSALFLQLFLIFLMMVSIPVWTALALVVYCFSKSRAEAIVTLEVNLAKRLSACPAMTLARVTALHERRAAASVCLSDLSSADAGEGVKRADLRRAQA